MNISTFQSLTEHEPCGGQSKPSAECRWRLAAWLLAAVILLSTESVRAQDSPTLVYQTTSTYVLTSSNRQVRIPAKGYHIFSAFSDDQSGQELTNITTQATWPNQLRGFVERFDLITMAGQKFCVISSDSPGEAVIQRVWSRGANMQTVLMVIDRDSAVDSYFRGRNSVIQFGIGASQTLEFPKVMTLAVHSLGGYVWDSNIHEYVKQATMEGKVTLMFSKSRSLQFNWPFTHDAGHAGLMNEILQKGYRFISRAEFLRSFD